MRKTKSFINLIFSLLVGIALILAAMAALGAITHAAGMITVTTAADEFNTDGDCSLREAIHAANYNVVVDACAAGISGLDVITFSLTTPTTITLSSQLEIKNNPLTIEGPGANLLAISGNNAVRVFDVTSAVAVTLTGVTVQNGFTYGDGAGLKTIGPLTIIDAAFINNTANPHGGAISARNNTAISNSLILSNTAANDGGGVKVYSPYSTKITGGRFENNSGHSFGGGLFADNLVISGTQFISNSTIGIGGGVFTFGDANVINAHFERNHAQNSIGGLYVLNDVQMTNSAFISNTAPAIGAIRAGGDATLIDSIFRGNEATVGNGGALYVGRTLHLTRTHFFDNRAATVGGALVHIGSNAEIVNSLLARNAAGTGGGALYLASTGNVSLLHATIDAPAQPVASAILVSATGKITALNTIVRGYTTVFALTAGSLFEDYNLLHNNNPTGENVTRGGHSIGGDPAFVDAGNDNYHLLSGSWALNNGATTALAVDVDGEARPGGGNIDIGFDETTDVTAAAIAKYVDVTPTPGAPITYTIVFTNEGGTMLGGVIITDAIPIPVEQMIVTHSGAFITDTGAATPYVWQVHPLAPGEGGVITVSGVLTQALARGIFTNTVRLSVALPPEPDTTDNVYSVSVTVPNFPPVAVTDVFTTAEDTPAVLFPLANDIDGDPLAIDAFTQPATGTVSLSGTTMLIYTPTLNFNGTEVFTYAVGDNEFTATTTISVVVTPVNDAPVITGTNPVTVTMSEDSSPTPFALALGAADVDGDSLGWSILSAAGHGEAAVEPGPAINATVEFTPTADYFGADSFIVQVSDGNLTDTVIVSVTVQPVNDAPVAVDDGALILNKHSGEVVFLRVSEAITVNVLQNDTDIEEDGLSVLQVGAPDQGGSATIDGGGGAILYTPAATFTGTETFTYTVTDGELTDSATVTATVLSGVDGGNNGETFTVVNRGEFGVVTITIQIPAGVEGRDRFALVYDEPLRSSAGSPRGLLPACNTFDLAAYLNSLQLADGHNFRQPLTMTLEYADAEVAAIGGPIEQSLMLYHWDGEGWSRDGIDVVERDTDSNRLTLTLNHASEFRLFRQSPVYLPLVMNNYVQAPDLVVQSITATTGTVEVVIANIGTGAVRDAFWVDVYLNPATPPTAVNRTWQMLGDQGLAWGIPDEVLPLLPGEVFTLTVGDAYYAPEQSAVKWPLVEGIPVYAQVDAANAGSDFGAVLELHEIRNEPYNNIRHTSVVSGELRENTSVTLVSERTSWGGMPVR